MNILLSIVALILIGYVWGPYTSVAQEKEDAKRPPRWGR